MHMPNGNPHCQQLVHSQDDAVGPYGLNNRIEIEQDLLLLPMRKGVI